MFKLIKCKSKTIKQLYDEFKNSSCPVERIENWIKDSHLISGLINSDEFKRYVREKGQGLIFVSKLATGKLLKIALRQLMGKEVEVKFYHAQKLEKRGERKKWFKQKEPNRLKTKLLIVSIEAGGNGVNFQEGQFIFNTATVYNPKKDDQAHGRIKRVNTIGRKMIYRVNCGTFLDRHREVIQSKKQAMERFTLQEPTSLMEHFRNWCEVMQTTLNHNFLIDSTDLETWEASKVQIQNVLKDLKEFINPAMLTEAVSKATPAPNTPQTTPESMEIEGPSSPSSSTETENDTEMEVSPPTEKLKRPAETEKQETIEGPNPNKRSKIDLSNSSPIVTSPQTTFKGDAFIVVPVTYENSYEKALALGALFTRESGNVSFQQLRGGIINLLRKNIYYRALIRENRLASAHEPDAIRLNQLLQEVHAHLSVLRDPHSSEGIEIFEIENGQYVLKESKNPEELIKIKLVRSFRNNRFHFDLMLPNENR